MQVLVFYIFVQLIKLLVALSSCPKSCSHVICIGEKTLSNFCKSGMIMDSCNCCHVCAKGESDTCGGYMDIQGKCREELICQTNKDGVGRCIAQVVKVPTKDFFHSTLSTIQEKPTIKEKCKPKCSAKYCSKNPNSICSARSLKLKKQECQGHCRHTVCSACFAKAKKNCVKCKQQDYECIKSFANCVRSNVEKIWDLSLAKKNGSHLFTCSIPGCS
ncbi:uncharacterized protein LOC105845851 isoform X1 [Hydra vulgaris]|uniref:uncharacterized protein LOC105845851 isoform X1 n=1 Tax=Hydra vulgaris TaxID=6087 RepID=UPI001F5E7440|nr:uncharacterized protein LOC105845851 [Hydra vulgaris]